MKFNNIKIKELFIPAYNIKKIYKGKPSKTPQKSTHPIILLFTELQLSFY